MRARITTQAKLTSPSCIGYSTSPTGKLGTAVSRKIRYVSDTRIESEGNGNVLISQAPRILSSGVTVEYLATQGASLETYHLSADELHELHSKRVAPN